MNPIQIGALFGLWFVLAIGGISWAFAPRPRVVRRLARCRHQQQLLQRQAFVPQVRQGVLHAEFRGFQPVGVGRRVSGWHRQQAA